MKRLTFAVAVIAAALTSGCIAPQMGYSRGYSRPYLRGGYVLTYQPPYPYAHGDEPAAGYGPGDYSVISPYAGPRSCGRGHW